jgi:hypothetical protein
VGKDLIYKVIENQEYNPTKPTIFFKCIQEIDGLRYLTNDGVYFISRVNENLEKVCDTFSSSPAKKLVNSYSNSQNIFDSCIYSLSIAIDNDIRFIDLIDNSNLINDILSKKFFGVDKIILHSNRILGEYIFKKRELSKDFYDKCTFYEMDVFFGAKSILVIRESLWVFCNIMSDNINSADIICSNKPLIDKVINIYKNERDRVFVRDIIYFFVVLFQIVNDNTFIQIENKGLIEISFEHAKNTLNDSKYIIIFFELIELALDKGDLIKEKFGGRNLIKEKCDNLGLRDLLRKYENCIEENLEGIILNIISKYY